jgi:hypothetical protein
MATTQQHIPLYEPNSREEEAELSLKRTSFKNGVTWTLVIGFLLTILAEGAVQLVADIAAARALQDRQTPPPRRLFASWDVGGLNPTARQIADARGFWGWWGLLTPVPKIMAFETSLEENSVIGGQILPRMQAVLTGRLGAGNEKVYPGHGQWLFYRPEVDYLTGPGFLDPLQLQARARAAAVQPDPVKALVRFQQQLAARGITLIVLPAPSKPMLHPERFSSRYRESAGVLQNPSYPRFCQALTREGIRLFDPATAPLGATAAPLAGARTPQYLATDTHWSPEAMALTARTLAAYLTQEALLPARPPAGYTRRTESVSNLGDIAQMLKLPAEQRIYRNETVQVQPVITPDGRPWSPDPAADILVLGDSYCNIYSLDAMGWGAGAGFVEQLSYYLQRPADRITINAGGSFASRQRLAQELARGKDRLAGKKVVIYEFAMRDLAEGDWKLLDLPTVTARPTPTPAQPPTPAPIPVVPEPGAAQASATVQPPLPLPAVIPPKSGTTRPDPLPVIPPKTGHSPIPTPTPTPVPTPAGLRVRGTVTAIAPVPKPGSVPYKDCLVAVHLSGVTAVTGTLSTDELLVFVWGLKDNRLMPPASFQPGQGVTLTLTAWEKVEGRLGGLNRVELDDDAVLLLDTYWGE